MRSAATLFGNLRLEINGGACAHDSSTPKPKIRVLNSSLSPKQGDGVITVFELSTEAEKKQSDTVDYNFAMHLPAKDPRTKFVQAIARCAEQIQRLHGFDAGYHRCDVAGA